MLHYFFHWYDGNVWGNILASLIVAVPAYLWGRFHVKKIHRKLDIQNYMHDLSQKKIEEIHKKVVKGG